MNSRRPPPEPATPDGRTDFDAIAAKFKLTGTAKLPDTLAAKLRDVQPRSLAMPLATLPSSQPSAAHENPALDRPLRDVNFRVIDFEATGLSVVHDEVIEVCVAAVQAERTTILLDTCIRPTRPLPSRITELTGITDDELATAPPLSAVTGQLLDALDGDCLVAHHAHSDSGYLQRITLSADPHWPAPPAVCTLKLARVLLPDAPDYSLTGLAEQLHLPLPRHRARADVLTTVALLNELLARAMLAGVATLGELLALHQGKAKATPPRLRISPLVIEAAPTSPGVYRFFDDADQLLYVGYSADLRRRLREHTRRQSTPVALELGKRATRVECEVCASELDAFLREGQAIASEKPALNRRHHEHGRVRYLRLTPSGAVTLGAEPASPPALNYGPCILTRSERLVLRGVRKLFNLVARAKPQAAESPGVGAFAEFITGDAVARPASLGSHALTDDEWSALVDLRRALRNAESERIEQLRPFRRASVVVAPGSPFAYAVATGRPTLRLDARDAEAAAQALREWLARDAETEQRSLDPLGARVSAFARAQPDKIRLLDAREAVQRRSLEVDA